MNPSTRIEPLLQIAVATLVVLGTFLLGMGQQDYFATSLAFVGGVLAVYLVDFRKLIRLNQFTSALFGLAGCVWLIIQIIRDTQQSQLLNVANALVFLELILLFQRKRERTYWHLITLSLLQVIVAAALNLGFAFGIMLCVYIGAAILTLSLFSVYRELSSLPVESARGQNRFLWLPLENSSSFVLSQSFLGRLVWLATFTFLGTILVFFAIPRYSSRVWQPSNEQIRTVGYDDEIELDNISRVLENPEQVMRVEFTRLDRTPFYFDDEPYFRGSVVDKYRPDSGRWRAVQLSEGAIPLQRIDSPDLVSSVIQNITLQPGEHKVLFHVSPCYASPDESQELFLKRHTRQLTLANNRRDRKSTLRFQLLTDAFRGNVQSRWTPALHALGPQSEEDSQDNDFFDYALETLISPWGRLYTERKGRLDPIKDLAEQLIADAQLTGGSRYEIALALENHFLKSPQYEYSLQMSTKRDHSLDPIVDFLTNHRTGHCEYFASALALMLRSQNIPARVVIGYKGGEYNGMGSYYTVRQLHAHAWVEIYLPENELPPDALPANQRENGAWLRLDPTPIGGRGTGLEESSPFVQKMNELFDYCQVLWDDYVLGLNSARQQQSIYRPIARAATTAFSFAFGKEAWQKRWRKIKRIWRDILSGRYFTRQSLILLAILTPLVYFMREQIWNIFRPIVVRFLQTLRGSRKKRSNVAVYDRLERLLRRNGLIRKNDQTPREFALSASQTLAAKNQALGDVFSIPSLIVDAFYRVRFGGETLSDSERRRLEESLTRLEQSLAQARRSSRSNHSS